MIESNLNFPGNEASTWNRTYQSLELDMSQEGIATIGTFQNCTANTAVVFDYSADGVPQHLS